MSQRHVTARSSHLKKDSCLVWMIFWIPWGSRYKVNSTVLVAHAINVCCKILQPEGSEYRAYLRDLVPEDMKPEQHQLKAHKMCLNSYLLLFFASIVTKYWALNTDCWKPQFKNPSARYTGIRRFGTQMPFLNHPRKCQDYRLETRILRKIYHNPQS